MGENRDHDVATGPVSNEARKGLFDRHPKLAIIAIAGMFYVILIGMCVAVLVIIWQG